MSAIDPLALVYITSCNGGVTDYDAHIRGLRAVADAVREQVAQEIEGLGSAVAGDPDADVARLVIEDAARIARGGAA